MRIPRPGPLRLERTELLRDVRDRIAGRLPQYSDGEPDPTDPGWMLIEEAAWMIEVLSGQLDSYPYSVIQQVMHLVGGQLLPARPAIGVAVLRASVPGVVQNEPSKPTELRLFTPQNENADVIEFVPVDERLPLCCGRIASLVRWDGAELHRVDAPIDPERGDVDGMVAWVGAPTRSRLFDAEVARYTVVTNKVEDTLEEFKKAIEMLDGRELGWIRLGVEQTADDRVTVDARIDLTRPFAKSTPDGFTTGGDVTARWGSLDDSTWTPPVTVSNHPLLPRVLRNTRPFPGLEDGTIYVPDVPANFPVAQLLQRMAAPIPGNVIDAVWATIGNMNTRLASMRPRVERVFLGEPSEGTEPTWVSAALASRLWDHLVHASDRVVAHITGLEPGSKLDTCRVALVLDPGALPRERVWVEFFPVTSGGVVPTVPMKKRVVWTVPTVMDRDGSRSVDVVGFDVKLDPDTEGLLVAVEGVVHGVFLNAALIANAPAISDERVVTVERNVPEPTTLLYEDLVTKEVIEQLLLEPIPKDTASLLENLPLARMLAEGHPPIDDFRGVQVDASSAEVTLNAADRDGGRVDIRPGTAVTLAWYRRTDGAWGNVPAGAIHVLEQPPGSIPSATVVGNPLPTVFGENREDPTAAVARLFGPSGGTPVLASDFEHLFRQALGSRCAEWEVRVWTYAERALVTTALWPLGQGDEPRDDETEALRREVASAGPSTLVLVVGPTDRIMSDVEFEQAAAVIKKRVAELRRRLPAVRDAVVGRLHPLTLETRQPPVDVDLPTWDTSGLQGELVDNRGRRAPPPVDTLLLNAVVTGATEPRDVWS